MKIIGEFQRINLDIIFSRDMRKRFTPPDDMLTRFFPLDNELRRRALLTPRGVSFDAIIDTPGKLTLVLPAASIRCASCCRRDRNTL